MVSVSIIICNYNYEKYIGDALESVLHQTIPDWECIVIDDGSTDNSVDIIKSYVERDSRFRLIQTEHGGTSRARNAGLDVATGEYIAFLDSDDCYTEYALEMLLHLARTTNADMAGGMANMVPAEYKYVPAPSRQTWTAGINVSRRNPSAFLLAGNSHKWCWLWRRIYRRDFIGDTRFHTGFTTFGEDLTFMLDLCYRANFVAESNNVTVFHRHHNRAITASPFDPHYFDWFPTYFRYIRDNLLDKYPTSFWCIYLDSSFRYLMFETIKRPRDTGLYQLQAKQALIESCQYIPRRYLSFKYRVLCWFLGRFKK